MLGVQSAPIIPTQQPIIGGGGVTQLETKGNENSASDKEVGKVSKNKKNNNDKEETKS